MQSRIESAAYLNGLGSDFLFDHYGITRVGNITGFDIIGIPVYNATRPLASVLSVNSGKGLSRELARSGAIAEAIEYATFEHPVGEFRLGAFELCEPELLPLARESKWTRQTLIPLEYATHFASGEKRLFPSDLLWMVHRRQKRMNFQMTSNGQAVGYSFEDAFLAGLYELIERDATTLSWYAWEKLNLAPPRVELSVDIFEPLKSVIESVGLKLFLFYCTVDIPVPVYWAILIDPALGGFFTTAGWGCDLNPLRAATKAVLEAVQSRCVYIAGARDDLSREDYNLHKARDPIEQMARLDKVPCRHVLSFGPGQLKIEQELKLVLSRLGQWQQNIYFNCLSIGPLFAVKTVILGLEPPRNALWVPSKRSITWGQVCTDIARNRYGENVGGLRQSLAMCCEMFYALGQSRFV